MPWAPLGKWAKLNSISHQLSAHLNRREKHVGEGNTKYNINKKTRLITMTSQPKCCFVWMLLLFMLLLLLFFMLLYLCCCRWCLCCCLGNIKWFASSLWWKLSLVGGMVVAEYNRGTYSILFVAHFFLRKKNHLDQKTDFDQFSTILPRKYPFRIFYSVFSNS